MENLSVVFANRDFTSRLERSDLKYTVNSFGFAAIGGCKEASISVEGGELGLWEAINMLRCPVEIFDDKKGIPIWWGMVHEAQVRMGALEVAVSLDSMVNRVAVAYSYVPPGTATVGTRKVTAWADDLDSQAEFGIKEYLSSEDGKSVAAAEARRDAILVGQRWPQGGLSEFGGVRGRVRYSGAQNSNSATLLCKGWWETLGWEYYTNTGTNSVATTTQIGTIVTGKGQFLTGTYVEAASGISQSEYCIEDPVTQTSRRTARQVIEGLLGVGGAGGRRLLASVDINRMVIVSEEPATSTCGSWMDANGQVYESGGRAVSEFTPPVGEWVRLKDVIPGVVDLTKLVDPSLQFIEEAKWSIDQGAQYTFKGKPSVESVLSIG